MIAALNILEIYPERVEVWKQVWGQLEVALRAAEGFRAVRLFHDADQLERYVILLEWEDRAGYDSFVRHIGVPWLHDALEYAPRPGSVMYLQEEAP